MKLVKEALLRPVDEHVRHLEFCVLGPLQVWEGGKSLDIQGPQRRRALALLLVHANEVVSDDWLADGLWAEHPPCTARTCLQNVVSDLRALIGRERLERRGPGYVLTVAPAQLDAGRFEQLWRQAAGKPAASKLIALKHALTLWRGVPYDDVFYEDFAQPEIRRLDELRLLALEDVCAATLELDAVAEAVLDLQALVQLHPHRESFRRQLMVALYRSGRPIEALVSYQEYRATLAAWQTEPGHAIAQTAQAIRDGDWSRLSGATQARPEPRAHALQHSDALR